MTQSESGVTQSESDESGESGVCQSESSESRVWQSGSGQSGNGRKPDVVVFEGLPGLNGGEDVRC